MNNTKAIKAVLDKAPVIAALKYAHVHGDKLTVTNLHTYLTVQLIEQVSDSPILVEPLQLMDILSKHLFPNFEVVDGALRVTTNDHTYTLTLGDVEDFPKIVPDGLFTRNGTLMSADVETMLEAVKYASRDILREKLMHVLLCEFIVGTDANRLFFEESTSGKFADEMLIHPRTIKLLSCFSGPWTVDHSDFTLRFQNSSGVTIHQRKLDVTYPDWRAVVPKPSEANTVCKISRKHLLSALANKAYVSCYTKQVIFAIEPGNPNTNVSMQNNDMGRTLDVRVPSQSTGLPVIFGANPQFMTDILKELDGPVVTFRIIAPNKAILINDNFIIMPAMLNIRSETDVLESVEQAKRTAHKLAKEVHQPAQA